MEKCGKLQRERAEDVDTVEEMLALADKVRVGGSVGRGVQKSVDMCRECVGEVWEEAWEGAEAEGAGC